MRRAKQNLMTRLRELEAAGCPTLLGDGLDLGPELKIHQVGGVTESLLIDLRVGTGYVLDVEITNDFTTPVYLDDVELRLPWGVDPHFRWLGPGDIVGRLYRLPGSSLSYDRNLALNDLVAAKARIGPKDRKAGLLLAFGGPIPREYMHGMHCHLDLMITDQHDDPWHAPVDLWVDRTETMSTRKRKPAPRSQPSGGSVAIQPSVPASAESSAMPKDSEPRVRRTNRELR